MGRADVADERGQSTILAVLVIGLAVVVLLVVAALGSVARDRAAARTAADAAALAGVSEGADAAEQAAQRNGGELESIRRDGAGVEATVRVGRARASARAEPEEARADARYDVAGLSAESPG